MAEALPGNLPADVRAGLEELSRRLEPLVPKQVVGAALYGGVAKGKAFTDSSDVNLLVVLRDGSRDALHAIAEPLREARRRSGVAPLVVSEFELELAMRAFPVKFHDICRHHLAWVGPDPLAGKSPAREWIRDNARQGLADLSLKLKRLYVDSDSPQALLDGLVDQLSHAVVSFGPLLHEKGPPVPEHREQLLEAVARVTGLSPKPLLLLLSIKKGQPVPGGTDAAALHRGLLDAVEAGARLLA
ncbi:MAG: hypothetical protein HY553_20915 [Elusimicrobia bacterium]|nr:hypothetical protein [Elusimicrobiota bacterium]